MGDEIVEEIRKIRDEFTASFNHDLDAIYRYFKKRERESGRNYVNLGKRPKKRKKSKV
jgi:hypothetical protein